MKSIKHYFFHSRIAACLLILILVGMSHWGLAATAQPLPADEAFQVNVTAKDARYIVHFKTAPGYYLYRERISIHTNPSLSQSIPYPKGKIKQDSMGRTEEIYTGNIDIPLPAFNADQQLQKVTIKYQGCSAEGFCYPPVLRTITVNTPASATSQDVKPAVSASPQAVALSDPQQQQSRPSLNTLLKDQNGIESVLTSQNYFVIMLIFMGLGLLLAFTPCVLPMVPILTGIIVGQKEISARKAFLLSLTYVLGTAITYAVAGMIAAQMGNSLQVWLQRPAVVTTVSLIFVLLALSLFGLFELRLPRRLQTQMHHLTNTMRGGTFIGVFGMGMLSTLIVSPCVTAPLVGVLLYIGETGNTFLGALALFAIGIGMGVPLMLIGTTAGKWLPKAGAWMEVIKKVFGIIMLMMAIWLLARTMTVPMANILWKVCLFGVAFVISGYIPRLVGNSRFHRGIGALGGFSAIFFMLIGFEVPNPMLQSTRLQQQVQQSFHVIRNINDFNNQLIAAQSLHKPVILDFYADWCDSCVSMDKNVFAKPQVKRELSNYVLLRADLTANNEQAEKLLKHFSVVAPPTILFFDTQGHEKDSQRIVGEVNAKEFLARLGNVNGVK